MVRKVDCGRLTPRQVGFVSSYVRDAYCRPESVMDAPDRACDWQSEFQRTPARPQSAPHPSMTRMVEEMHHDWVQGRPKTMRPKEQRVIRDNMIPAFPVINWANWLDVQAAQMRRDDRVASSPGPQNEQEHASPQRNACSSPFDVVSPWKTGDNDRHKARLWKKRRDETNRRTLMMEKYMTATNNEVESDNVSREVFRPRTLSRGSPMWEQHGGRKSLPRPVKNETDLQLHGIRRCRPEAASRIIKKRV
eukprot:GEMP01039146.1.p1 GENE.GEMP01039146.1~~GEMP01039146.1.p1  ORF type:complete len:249 (+),score=64.92 GEMP01039146.1:129-875(+)